MFRLSGFLLERRGHAFFSGFPCNSDMFLASGEIGDTGKPEQRLLF